MAKPMRHTILVVDDDPGLQSMFKLFLKKQGFSRLVVGTGKEAIAALQKQHFDLCFLDLQLPDFTGDEVYKQAKEIDRNDGEYQQSKVFCVDRCAGHEPRCRRGRPLSETDGRSDPETCEKKE